MSTLRDLVKDRKVYSIDAERNGELTGIFSERDIMNRVVAAGRTPGHTAVSEVMTANPRAVNLDETVEECLFIMHEFGFRHLPIVEGKELKGLVSLRDVVMRQAGELQRQARRTAS
jgi:CBS domain-containing protein